MILITSWWALLLLSICFSACHFFCLISKRSLSQYACIIPQVCLFQLYWLIMSNDMHCAATAAKSLQSCLTLCDPIDGSLPGSPIPGILQARTLECVAISFSNAWKWKVKSESEVAQSCQTLCDPMYCSLPGKSTGVGCHCLLQHTILLLLLLLSRFSRVWPCATPWTAAHQAPPFLGFSKQEHWSGLPFPSPMHGSEKWKWSCVWLLVTPWIAAHQAPPSMGFSRQEYWSGVPLPSMTMH